MAVEAGVVSVVAEVVDLAAAAGVDLAVVVAVVLVEAVVVASVVAVAVVVAVVAVAEEDLLLALWPLIKDRCKLTRARRSLSEVWC